MKLKYRILKLNAGIPIAVLDNKTAKKLGARAKDRISIKTFSNDAKEIFTILDTDPSVKTNIIFVSEQIKDYLGLKKHGKVEVSLSFPSNALLFIKKKLNNHQFSKKELEVIIKGVVDNSLSESEIALFISLMYEKGMNFKETLFLIQALLKFGDALKIKNKFVVDKHCIGGVPGNRTTPIVVSVCAAAGLTFHKSSSRAINSAAGTADVIVTLAKVDLPLTKL